MSSIFFLSISLMLRRVLYFHRFVLQKLFCVNEDFFCFLVQTRSTIPTKRPNRTSNERQIDTIFAREERNLSIETEFVHRDEVNLKGFENIVSDSG